MNLNRFYKKILPTTFLFGSFLTVTNVFSQDLSKDLSSSASLPISKHISLDSAAKKLNLLNKLPYRTLEHLVKYYNPEDSDNEDISYKFEHRQKRQTSLLTQNDLQTFIAIATSTNNSALFRIISEHKIYFDTTDRSDLIYYLSYAKRNGFIALHLCLRQAYEVYEASNHFSIFPAFSSDKKRKGICGLDLEAEKSTEKKGLNLLKLLCSVYADIVSTLDLTQLNIECEGARAIASEARFKNLKHLDLGFNNIEPEGATAVLLANHLKSLKALNLQNNNIGIAGAIAFASATHLTNLKSLHLGWNQIEDEGVKALLTFSHLSNIEDLGLSSNNIGDDGAEALAEASIHLKNLQYLYLHNNKIGDKGAEALAEAGIHLKNLKRLEIYNNNIGENGEKALQTKNMQTTVIFEVKNWIDENKDWTGGFD